MRCNKKRDRGSVSAQLGQTRLSRTRIYSIENEVLISISLWYRVNISRCIRVLFWWGKISGLQTTRSLYLTCFFFSFFQHLIDSDVIKSKQKAQRWCLYSSLDVCDCLVRCHPLSLFFPRQQRDSGKPRQSVVAVVAVPQKWSVPKYFCCFSLLKLIKRMAAHIHTSSCGIGNMSLVKMEAS